MCHGKSIQTMFTTAILVVGFSLSLSACMDNPRNKSGAKSGFIKDFSVSENEIQEQALSVAKTPNAAQSLQLKKTFIERNALAEVIASRPDLNLELEKITARLKKMRNEIIIKTYLENTDIGEVTDQDINEYYQDNLATFNHKKARLAHIFLRSKPGDPKSFALTQKKAEYIVEQIKKGKSFESMVKMYSEDIDSKAKNGELGEVTTGKPNGDLLPVVANLQVGGVSSVHFSTRGAHIIKLLAPMVTEPKPLAEIKDQIAILLKSKARNDKLNELKTAASERINKDLARLKIQALGEEPAPVVVR